MPLLGSQRPSLVWPLLVPLGTGTAAFCEIGPVPNLIPASGVHIPEAAAAVLLVGCGAARGISAGGFPA
jgi:hypothetical protein